MSSSMFPEWPIWDEQEIESLTRVVRSGRWWAGSPEEQVGENVWAFQREFARLQESRHCIAVANGTVAIETALMALEIGFGDEVIVPDYTFVASASAVVAVNAVPVFCDIHPETLVMDVEKLESLLNERTRAVVAVHLGGNPVDMERLCALAEKYDLAVVEDCAHAQGSRYKGRTVGNWGHAGTFSFQASKILTAGEGGAIVCNDGQLAERIYGLSDCGRRSGKYFYEHFSFGGNCRMSEFNAAVLRVQLRRFAEQHRRRNANARYLSERLNAIPGIRVMKPTPGTEEIGYYVFPFLFDPAAFPSIDKERFRAALEAAGIPTVDCYPPLHRLICFREQRLRKGIDYSRSNWVGEENPDTLFPVVVEVYARSIELPHQVLLADRGLLDRIPEAIRRLQSESKENRS